MSYPPQPPPYGQQPPPYGQQSLPYGQQPYGQPGYPAPTRMNGLAIAALIISFFIGPLAFILGFTLIISFFIGPLGFILGLIALQQINKSNGSQTGKGLATAGIVIGAISILFILLAIIISTTSG